MTLDKQLDAAYNTNMVRPSAVIDTNVVVAAMRSRLGYSYRLVSALGGGQFDIAISVPLVLEYESALKRLVGHSGLTAEDIEDVIDYICSVALLQNVYYLWRPFLPDAKDDMVLEVAVAAGCDYIVTFNRKDFRGSNRFGVIALEPKQFVQLIGTKP